MVEKKALKALNDAIELPLEREESGYASIQYGAFGEDGVTAATGTVVVEVSNNGVEWYPLKLTKNDNTVVDNLLAAGIAQAFYAGYNAVRARMSVIGGAQGVMVSLGMRST
jgi:hypothetical protein